MVSNGDLVYLNYILFGANNNEDESEQSSDININKYFDYKIKNTKASIENIFPNLQKNETKYTFNYDYNQNKYIEEFFCNIYDANYYSASFNDNSKGLERSQLKTLSAIRKLIRENNKYIPINGGPGTGKSTLFNYVLSNILIDNMLLSYWPISKTTNFVDFIRSKKYKKISILATGSTIASVQNIVDICKINMPKNHIWFKQEIYNNFLNRLDYTLIENKTEFIEQFLNKYFSSELEMRKTYFSMQAKKYFNINNISWEMIPQKCYEKISYNCRLISSINKAIKDVIDNNDDNLISEYINEIKLNSNLNKIIKNIENNNIDINNKKQLFEQSKKLFNDSINDITSFYSVTNDIEIKKLLDDLKNRTNKLFDISNIKFFFTSIKSIKQQIEKIKELLNKFISVSSKKTSLIIRIIKNSVNILNEIFNDKELFEMGLKDFIVIDFSKQLTSNDLLTIVSSFNILQINFNIIQKEIDKKIRSENTYLFRHIQEWLFLDKNATDLTYIWPIVSSNIQKFSHKKINKNLWNINHFDFTIVDEAGQTNSIYLFYLNQLSNKIIAVGDEKQLQTINENKKLNMRLSNVMNSVDNEKFKSIINLLWNKLQLICFSNNEYQFIDASLLDKINELSNVYSIINGKKYKGLYLLEHFRCPNQIFNLINQYYYNNMLNCPIKDDYTECVISNCIGNNICCDECSLIQIKYKYNQDETSENGKINYREIEIGLNLVIDNLGLFIKHFDLEFNGYIEKKHLDYLKNNIAFVTLYKD